MLAVGLVIKGCLHDLKLHACLCATPLMPQEHYPWFLPTYLSYPYNIQRVDVLRYFILHKLGGVYIDLDMGCRHNLDFMLLHNFTAPMTHPVGISNDVMAARPGDAYLGHLLPRLAHWNRWLGIKYIQVGSWGLLAAGRQARLGRWLVRDGPYGAAAQ